MMYIYSNYIIEKHYELDEIIEGLNKIIDNINHLGFTHLLVKVIYDPSVTNLSDVIKLSNLIRRMYTNVYVLYHVKFIKNFDKKTARRILRNVANKINTHMDNCKLLSIDEEYLDILSVNEIKSYRIIEGHKLSYRNIAKTYSHNLFFEIYIDKIIRNIETQSYILPRIKILEGKNKVIISQSTPVISRTELPIIYSTLLDDKRLIYKEIYLRLNILIEDVCKVP